MTSALLDTGSEATLISQALSDVLMIKSSASSVRLRSFHGSDPSHTARRVRFKISSLDGGISIDVNCAYVVEDLYMKQQKIYWPNEKRNWAHLDDLPLPPFKATDAGLVIGADLPIALKQLAVREPASGAGPLAVQTPFGWTIIGPVESRGGPADEGAPSYIIRAASSDISWLKNEFPTKNESRLFKKEQEERALSILKKIRKNSSGHYVVPLLWKSSQLNLPDNKGAALKFLFANEARCRKDPIYCERFYRLIKMYEEMGFARKLNPNELRGPKGKTWYLPYMVVEHKSKPDKPRLVFHGSKEFEGTSVNKELLATPKLIVPLSTVIIHLREGQVGVSMDIKGFFLQVGVPEDDQSVQRYLYRPQGSNGPPETYQMMVHMFGLASSMTACTYALHQTVRDNPEFKDVAERLLDSTYVDNYADSYDDEPSAARGCGRLVQLVEKGGFKFVQVASSSRAVLRSVPMEMRSDPNLNLDFDELPVEPTLGCRWNCEADCFTFSIALPDPPTTKREMLRAIARVFDPLGFLVCVTISCRLLLQEVWRTDREESKRSGRKNQHWDRKLSQDLVKSWEKITSDWAHLSTLEIPRRLQPVPPNATTIYQLHIFCDASLHAQGAVAFLRVKTDGNPAVSFLQAKSKTAIDTDTAPQGELKAARMGAGLEKKLRKALRLKIGESFLWFDSEAVLHWTCGTPNKKNPRYVAAHRDAILLSAPLAQKRYVPTGLNPADDITRGVSAKDMHKNHRFYRAPDFLWQEEEFWPEQPDVVLAVSSEIRDIPIRLTKTEESLLELIEESLSLAELKQKAAKMLYKSDSAADLYKALLACVSAVQEQEFREERRRLRAAGQIQHSSRLRKLGALLGDDGVLRVEGRLERAEMLSESQRHPIILPADGAFTKLVVLDAHLSLLHSSIARTLFDVRRNFWILRGRQSVRRFLNGCIDCKKRTAPARQVKMAPLPEARMAVHQPVFCHTGIDYLGPFYVTVKRSTEKRWIALFTCLTVRAIHLELVVDLSAAAFLNAYSSFISLRGPPRFVYSDNGTNLRAGERELREGLERVMQDPAIGFGMKEKGISWRWNPPGAPHMGGAWERLVRSVKTALVAAIGDQPVKEDVLRTALASIASLINGRPLTELRWDPRDPRPLTPNHFLLGRECRNIQPDVFEEPVGQLDRNRWVAAQQLTGLLWKWWLRVFLPGLMERQKWTTDSRALEVGDMVLVMDMQAPRGSWPTGEVVGVFEGKDKRVRSVDVKIGEKVFHRPAVKLVLLREGDKG